MKFLIFIFSSFLFLGCTHTIGKRLSDAEFSKLKEGETTREDVIKLLGKPQGLKDTSNYGDYYSKVCGEKDIELEALIYVFMEGGGVNPWSNSQMEQTTILVRKSDNKFCRRHNYSFSLKN